MINLLIPSMQGDTDSLAVTVAMRARGHKVQRVVGDSFPSQQKSSLKISDEEPLVGRIGGNDMELDCHDIDVVWLRRPRWPVVPVYVDPLDVEMCERENKQFFRSLYATAFNNAIWINSLEARRRAGSKVHQLKIARDVLLSIPDTLVSNDYDEIRNFLKTDTKYVVKPLSGGHWNESGSYYCTFTAEIDAAALPSPHMVQACAAIYQKKVMKAYEVRAVFFGQQAFAARIDSQLAPATSTDWRIGDIRKVGLSPLTLPAHIREACIAFMKKLGVVHGSFDFAVTTSDEWIFFEMNEAGQFLWLESYVGLPVFDAFLEFLESPGSDFSYRANGRRVLMKDTTAQLEYKELLEKDASSQPLSPGGLGGAYI